MSAGATVPNRGAFLGTASWANGKREKLQVFADDTDDERVHVLTSRDRWHYVKRDRVKFTRRG